MAVSKRLRFEVLRRDGYRCRYCGAGADRVELEVDHVTPVSLGGADVMENLVTACEPCNSGKSSTAADAPVLEIVAVPADPTGLRRTAWFILGTYEDAIRNRRPTDLDRRNAVGMWAYRWSEVTGEGPTREQVAAFEASVSPAVMDTYGPPVLWSAAHRAAEARALNIVPHAVVVHEAVQGELRRA